MIRTAPWLATLLICFTNIAIAQKSKKQPVKKPTAISQFAVAEKAWAPFWNSFSVAVRSHDKRTFKDLISKDSRCFNFYACKCSEFSDKRDSFFCNADQTEVRLNIPVDWWRQIDWIFTKPSKIRKIRLGKVQKVDGEITRTIEYVHPDTWKGATFKFENNMKWHFLDVGTGRA